MFVNVAAFFLLPLRRLGFIDRILVLLTHRFLLPFESVISSSRGLRCLIGHALLRKLKGFCDGSSAAPTLPLTDVALILSP